MYGLHVVLQTQVRKNINPPIILAVVASSKSQSFGLAIFTYTYFLLLLLEISRNIELKFNVELQQNFFLITRHHFFVL